MSEITTLFSWLPVGPVRKYVRWGRVWRLEPDVGVVWRIYNDCSSHCGHPCHLPLGAGKKRQYRYPLLTS